MMAQLKRYLTPLFYVTNATPTLRQWLRPIGLRLDYTVFKLKKAIIPTPYGQPIQLSSIHRNYLSFELFWKGLHYYEPLTVTLFSLLAQQHHDQFLDIGANIGLYSLLHHVIAPRCPIQAFEPNEKLHSILAQNFVLNGISSTPSLTAISNENCEKTWYQSYSDMSGSLEQNFQETHAFTTTVHCDTLDHILARQPPQTLLIKIDTEGHKLVVLQGMQHTLKQHNCLIIIECTISDDTIVQSLHDMGYHFFAIHPQGLAPVSHIGRYHHEGLELYNYLMTQESEVTALSSLLVQQTHHFNLQASSLKH